MLMILVAGASSVTSVWRLSCHRPTTFAFLRNFVHAALNVVTGRVTFSTFCLMNRQNLHPTTCGSPGFLPCFRTHSALAPNLQYTGPGRGVT